MIERSFEQIVTTPPEEPGFIGEGHTAVEVFGRSVGGPAEEVARRILATGSAEPRIRVSVPASDSASGKERHAKCFHIRGHAKSFPRLFERPGCGRRRMALRL